MSQKPSRAEAIVDFVLKGKTQREVMDHFGYSTRHSANSAIYNAFKRLGIDRPPQKIEKECEYCGKRFIAHSPVYRFCGNRCKRDWWYRWGQESPERTKASQKKYVYSAKGKERNRRRHRMVRKFGRTGNAIERWRFAVDESSKAIRVRKRLSVETHWDRRILMIYRAMKYGRVTGKGRSSPNLGSKPTRGSSLAATRWNKAFQAMQSAVWRRHYRMLFNPWEKTVRSLRNAIRIRERNRR